MGAVFPALRVPPAPNSQRGECGGTPPVTELVKETVRGMVPSFGEAVISTTRGGGGGGGGGVTMTVAVWVPVNPPVSFASRVTLYVPGTANWCCAVASLDHGVSQVPSLSQSHRTWSRFGGSWASNEVEVNVKTVDVSPLAGVQLKFAYGGMFVGGGRGGGVKVTFTLAIADGLPALSKACASISLTPNTRVTLAVQSASPVAVYHPPPETRTFTTRRPLPPESEAIPVMVIDDAFTVAPSGGDVIATVGGAVSSWGGLINGYRSAPRTWIGYGVSPIRSGPLQTSCPGPLHWSAPR